MQGVNAQDISVGSSITLCNKTYDHYLPPCHIPYFPRLWKLKTRARLCRTAVAQFACWNVCFPGDCLANNSLNGRSSLSCLPLASHGSPSPGEVIDALSTAHQKYESDKKIEHDAPLET